MSSKEYTVKNIVKRYQKLVNTQAKEKFLSDVLSVKNYIPVNTKVTYADIIANNTSFDKDGNFKLNSSARMILCNLKCIDLYTNLKVDFTDMDNEYDLLKESGLYDSIMKALPEKDLSEFYTFVDLCCGDLEANYNSPKAYVSREVERFGTLIGVSTTPLLNKIANGIDNLDDVKTEKIAKAIGKFSETLFKK